MNTEKHQPNKISTKDISPKIRKYKIKDMILFKACSDEDDPHHTEIYITMQLFN